MRAKHDEEAEHNDHEVGATTRTVFKIGQSVAITLPKDFVETHGIKKGDKLVLSYNSFLILDPKHREKIIKEMKEKRRDQESVEDVGIE